MKKICIQPSFVLLLIIMIALGYPGQFFIMFLAVTLHEAAHIATALYFNLEFKKIIITPLGEIAVIETLNQRFYKRFLTVMAGPLASALIGCAAQALIPEAKFFIVMNFGICLFNLIPAYPLDGGGLLYMMLSPEIGNLTAGKAVSKLTKIISACLILIGLVQAVLFPYNISLFCIGVYLYKESEKEYVNKIFEFYKTLAAPERSEIMKVRHYRIERDTPIKKVLGAICFDRYNIFYVTDNGNLVNKLTQRQITEHAVTKGILGTVGEINGTQ